MRFSVIVPLFNKAEYVARSLGSISGQTFSDYEVIVMDDGSIDGSYEVAMDSARKAGPKFRVFHQENAGASTARNNAANMAVGDYLCFLDADDWWASDYLSKMDEFIDGFPDAGIYGSAYFYVKNGLEQVRVDIPTGYFNYFKEYSRIMQMPLWTGAVCVPSRIFREVGGFKPYLELGEDFDLWVRIALEYRTAFLNVPLSFYNQDVDASKREIGRLHAPEHHMLWNLDYLADAERNNPDLKQLIDNLRVYGLMPYYLTDLYHEAAVAELAKVDWELQPTSAAKEYRTPVWVLKAKSAVMRRASAVKQAIIRKLK